MGGGLAASVDAAEKEDAESWGGIKMMTDIDLLRFSLEQEGKRLIEELERLNVNGGAKDERQKGGSFGNREEAADATTELERRIALETQERNSLAEVEHALRKINAGTYGICDNCGQPIESARLEALPQTTQCMTCKVACKK